MQEHPSVHGGDKFYVDIKPRKIEGAQSSQGYVLIASEYMLQRVVLEQGGSWVGRMRGGLAVG